MNPEVKEKWLSALRSGEYEQTTSALEHNGGYCCLGVLCDVALKEGITERRQNGDIFSYGDDVGGWNDCSLPENVMVWAGLRSADPNVDTSKLENDENLAELVTLSTCNDSRHYDFETIADLIEGSL